MKHCPNCGAKLSEDAQFCTECGTKLSNFGTQTTTAEPVTKVIINKLKRFKLVNGWQYLLSLLFCMVSLFGAMILQKGNFSIYLVLIVLFTFNGICLDPDKNTQYYKYKAIAPRYMVVYGMILGLIFGCSVQVLSTILTVIAMLVILGISILFIMRLFHTSIPQIALMTPETITTLMLIGTFCLGFTSVTSMMSVF